MQTLLDINDFQNTNMFLYAGAMAGGVVAGPDLECSALRCAYIANKVAQKVNLMV